VTVFADEIGSQPIIHFDLSSAKPIYVNASTCLIVLWWTDCPVGQVDDVGIPGRALDQAKLMAAVPADILTRAKQIGENETANRSCPAKTSVVICTRDRSDTLARCLASFSQQTLLPSQIIVVDNASTDGRTCNVAQAAGAQYVREDRLGLDIARNVGARVARGEIIAYTDDDVILHPRWLERLVNAFDAPEVMAVTGLVLPAELETEAQRHFETYWGFGRGYRRKDFGTAFFSQDRKHGCRVWEIGAGANMAFRRAAIDGLLFNTHLGPSPTFVAGGDEVDFMRQVRQRGGAVVWCPGMRIKHCVPPERATLPYLEKYTRAKGCEHVLLANRDTHRSGAEVAVPNWLWRAYATALVREWAGRVGPAQLSGRLWSGPAPASNSSRRVRQLVGVRERCFLGGMIEGFRKQPRSRTVTVDPRPAVHSSVGQRP